VSKNRTEEENFERIEREKLARLRAQLERENLSSQQRIERELHFHKCGKCGANMDTKLFRGVEIEPCPRCGAVLLDSGELEKIAGEESGVIKSIKALFGRNGD